MSSILLGCPGSLFPIQTMIISINEVLRPVSISESVGTDSRANNTFIFFLGGWGILLIHPFCMPLAVLNEIELAVELGQEYCLKTSGLACNLKGG